MVPHRVVKAREPCQLHSRAQKREPHRPALEYVSWPMQAIDIDFFKRHMSKFLLLMEHFSGFPMYARMGYSTDTTHTVKVICNFWCELVYQM